MNRAERRSVARLPTHIEPWEIGLAAMPLTVDGIDTEGILVIAEGGTGNVRAAGPVVVGQSLWPILGEAFTNPAPPGAPARPGRLRCADPELIRRLNPELRGLDIRIELVPSVPAAEAVLAAMFEHLTPIAAPGITRDLDLWRVALETLVRQAPWRAVSDGVSFRFGGAPELDGLVAIVLGLAGEQIGVAVYPSEEDHARFRRAAIDQDVAALQDLESLNLYLDPLSELEPREVAACREAKLVTSKGLCPRVLVLAGGVPSRATEQAERILLAVVQGLVALTARGADDLELAHATCVAATCLGAVEVRSTPPVVHGPPELVDVDHATGMIRLDGRSALVIKLRKRDALALAATLVAVDGLRIEPEGAGVVVHALVGARDLGPLVHLPREHDRRELAGQDRVLLCISAGGPQRPRVQPRDFVMSREVAVSGGGRARGHDPMFDQPPSTWPKGSETLLRFVEPLLSSLSTQSVGELQRALEMAMTVWNAVVMADLAGEPKFLDELLRGVAREAGPGALVHLLIERKRARYGGDPRILGPVRVEAWRTGPKVFVETRLPPGYRAG